MPYILQEDRDKLDVDIDSLMTKVLRFDDNGKKGVLNYIISQLLSKSLKVGDTKYWKINDAVGILECAKLELYRRLASYEDGKRRVSGDLEEYERANS